MNIKRVAIFIDGSNFYFKMRSLDIANLSRFSYRRFGEWLARDGKIVFAGYYIGVVRAKPNDDKAQKLQRGQVNLFNFLQSKEQHFTVRRGYLMNNDGVYHEKGVDVQLAVDLLVGAYENQYDAAIVISSDTDLIPAMAKVKQLGKVVEYIGFAHQPALALQTAATLSRLLLKEELEPFIYNPS